MKKIIVFTFLLISSITYGQNSERTKDSLALNAPTEIGTPDGELVSKKIGKEGGTLTSSDNKITLIIPAGALPSETLISIQPSTNFAKESVGKSYELEPSGIQFQKPVSLIFHYTDKEMDGQSPKLMGVAWQNDKGVWKGLNKINLDTILKTITADIKHFSGYVLGWVIVLEPEKTRIKVSKDMVVFLYQREIQDAPGEGTTERIFFTDFRYKINWFVNGIPDGNNIVGKIVPVGRSLSRVYEAPAQVPDNNPVEIKVEITDIKKPESGQNITIIVQPKSTVTWTEQVWTILQNTTKKCNVQIYDNEYEVKMESVIISGGKGVWGGIRTARDKGSFYVSLDKEPEISKIQNMLEVMKDDCTNILLNPTTCTGLLHVAGAKQIKVTPANPPGQPYPIVEIWFVPFPMEFSKVRFNCPSPDRSTGNSIGVTPAMPALGYAFPQYLKFIARDGEQIIIESPKGSDDGYLKVWVNKIKEE